MDNKLKPEEIKGWVTRNGKHQPIPKEDSDEIGQEKKPSVESEKEKNKEEAKKHFVKRFGLQKTPFKIRDKVSYDQLSKMGTISGFMGDSINILDDRGVVISRHKDHVFKVSELIKGMHWDAMDSNNRYDVLKEKRLSEDYLNTSWYWLPFDIRNVMLKAQGPAGYEGGGVNTVSTGVFNPIHQEKTVSEKMKEQEEKEKNPEKKSGY